ncbi:MAG TPA: histidine phosphatase family protein [Jiangellaceae bacterium]
MNRRVVLWRHGRTEWNATGRFQGQIDVPLDAEGHRQALDAARRLAALEPDLLLSSDLQRTQQTAAALAKLTGLDVMLDERLRETYAGEWEGCTIEEIARRFPDQYAAWRAGDSRVRVGGGESREEVAERIAAGVTDAVAKIPDDGLAVLTSHGGASRLGIGKLIGMSQESYTSIGPLSNCSWSMMRKTEHGWILVEHNAGTLPEPVGVVEG